jgi:subtilisin family serine protease
MKYAGHLMLTLLPGEARPHIPTHLDCLAGAARPAGWIDQGPIDKAVKRYAEGGRVACVFHARESLGLQGQQHVDFDDVEENLGMSRTYKLQLADPAGTASVLSALRDLQIVESAAVQTLATAPMAAAPAAPAVDLRHAWEPHERIHAAPARALEPGDQRVTVAIVDTGIIVGHPELQRKCLAGYDTVDLGMGRLNGQMRLVGDSRGWDYNPHDDVGHGCHVAGIIGAQGWNIPPGVAGLSLLLAVRVLAAAVSDSSSHRMGVGGLADIDAGMKVAIDLGGRVLNMSYGTPQSSVDKDAPLPHRRVVDYAMHHGCILVAAAGNSGIAEKYYPAALPEVIAVGSVDDRGMRSRFSTFGDHLAICAPGERIASTGLTGYAVNSGTSFASPFVAGVAALLVSRAHRHKHRLTGPEAKQILIRSAAPLGGGGFHPETGYGMLDASAALRELDVFLGSRK